MNIDVVYLFSEIVNLLVAGFRLFNLILFKYHLYPIMQISIILTTKHTKPNQANPQGGIVQKSAPLDISNVMYVSKGKVSRVGFKVEDGKKVRYAKATGEVID